MSRYTIIDCPLCADDARYYPDGQIECMGEPPCDPADLTRPRASDVPPVEEQELAPGEPPRCPDTQLYRHDTRSCLACATRQAWVAQEARKQVTEQREEQAWTPPPTFGSLADELADELPTTAWVIEGLLSEGANLLVAAEAKAGKTTLALNMARSLVDGEPLFGHLPVRASRVGWWNLELPRAKGVGWLREMDVRTPADLAVLHLRGHAMPLMTRAAQRWAVKWLLDNRVDTWIVDPLGALYDGDENDNSAVRDYLKALDQIRTKAGVGQLVVITHTGHQAANTDNVRTRGASVFQGWPDVLVQYRRGAKNDPLTADTRYLSAFGRDVELDEAGLAYEADTRSLLWQGGSRKEDAGLAKARQAWEVLNRADGPMTTGELRSALRPGNNEVLDRAIATAVREGWVIKEQVNRQLARYTAGQSPYALFTALRPGESVGPPL